MKEKLIKSTSWSYAAKLAATVLFFVADILIARLLEVGVYAEWAFFFSLLSMGYYVFWFGVNHSSRVFISKADPGQDDCRERIRAGFRVRTLVTLALTLLSVLAILLLPHFSFWEGLERRYPFLRTLLLIAPFIAALNSYAEFFKETEVGVRDFRGLFILTSLEYGTILIAGTLGAGLFRSAKGVGFGFLAAYAATFLTGFLLVGKWNAIGSWRSRSPEGRQLAGRIFRYALPLALIGIGGVILVEMDTMMLGVMGTAEDVSNYAIAKQICTKASHINNALAMGTLASFSVIHPEEYPEKRKAFSGVARINLILTLGTGLAMLLLAGPAIRLLYGEKYTTAASIIRCLVPYYILYGLSAFYALFLDYHGKAGGRSFWYAAMVLINLVLNLLLIPRFGTTGACIATAVSLVPYTLYLLYESYNSVWKELRKSHEAQGG